MLDKFDPNVLSAVISVIGSVLSMALGSFLMWFFSRRKATSEISKIDADAAAVVADAAKALIDPLNEQIRKLTKTVEDDQKLRADEKKRHAEELSNMQEQRATDQTQSTQQIIELQAQLELVKRDSYHKEGQIQELRGGIDVLIGQLKQLNIVPKYNPGH